MIKKKSKSLNSRVGANLIKGLIEGVSSYLTFEARCGMSPAYCEQFIYGPIVRIAKNLNWNVLGEVAVNKTAGKKKDRVGDYLRVDFVLERNKSRIAIEVKYLKPTKKTPLNIKSDVEKLETLLDGKCVDECYLLVVGRFIKGVSPKITGKKLNQPSMKYCINTSKSSYGVAAYQIHNCA